LYPLARDAYREAANLMRSDSRVLNDELRRHALRAFEHCTVASDPVSVRRGAQSLRYAKMALLKLVAVLDAAECGRHFSVAELVPARAAVARLIREIDEGLQPSPLPPSDPPPVAPDTDGEREFEDFPPFDPSRVISSEGPSLGDIADPEEDDAWPGGSPH
jgi:hypothetical protein